MVKLFFSELNPILLNAICWRTYFVRFLRKQKVIEFSRNKEISDRKFINFWGTNKTKQTIKKKKEPDEQTISVLSLQSTL